MKIRSFIIAYALVLAILLFADRRNSPIPQDRYSHVVDLTAISNDASSLPAQTAMHDSLLHAATNNSAAVRDHELRSLPQIP